MTNILTHISTYDFETHTPYPTLEFIKTETGEDLVENNGSNVHKAQAQLRQFTDAAYSILKDSKMTLDTINRLEYKIATDEEYRMAFLKYVAKVIFALYNTNAAFLFKEDGKHGLDKLPTLVRDYVKSSVLNVGKFLPFKYEYRVGY